MGNLTGKIQGCKNFPLSKLGMEQRLLLADYFNDIPVNYIYSSDLERAFETASAIGEKKKLTVHAWDKIREVNLGPFQGLTREEIYENFPITIERSIITSGVEGTETISELTERCKHVLTQLQLAHDNDDVVLVSHGGFISVLLMYILTGEEWSKFHRPFKITNTSITQIEWKKGSTKPTIHYMNKTDHLERMDQVNSKMNLL